MPSVEQPQTAAQSNTKVTTVDPNAFAKRKIELLSKVRILHEAMARRGSDFTGANPAMSYMWVNIREDRQTWFQGWGYRVCTDPAIKSPYKKEDGTIRRSDLILYEIDREMAEAHQAYRELRGMEGIEGHKQSAIESMSRAGVRAFIPET